MCEGERAGSDNAVGYVVDKCEIMRAAAVMSDIPGSGRCSSSVGLGKCVNVTVGFLK